MRSAEQIPALPSVDELVEVASTILPTAIIAHAAGGEDLYDAFEYSDIGTYAFGDRLIMLSGLALCGLYIHCARLDPDARGDHYTDFVRTILFQRGYDRGIACALFQRVGQVGGAVFESLRGEDRAITAFVALRRLNAANTVRARMRQPLEQHILSVIARLKFLQRFVFDANGTVRFDGSPVRLWPFLRWDGDRLLRIREPRDRTAEGIPEALEWVGADESDSVVEQLTTEDGRELRHIAVLVRHAREPRVVELSPPTMESVVPLFADTHPQMCALAQLVQKKANPDTIARLLVPFLKAELGRDVDHAEARTHAADTLLVENAIIRQCIEHDPIAVLKTYLENEPGDIIECLALLTSSDERATELYNSLRARTKDLRNRLEPLYADAMHKEAIEKQVDAFAAQIAAKEIARLLGFRIVEQHAREPVDAYISRVAAFEEYVAGRRRDLVKVAGGLLECSKIAHEVLAFLIQFYSALKFYAPEYEDGIDAKRRPAFKAEMSRIARFSFDKATKSFEKLRTDDAISQAVRTHLNRPMWSENAMRTHVDALNELRRDWRNEYAHRPGVIDTDAQRLVSKFLDFLKWLQDPARTRTHRDRIYPAILHLNVLTMNQCGITSVKYGLTETGHDRAIRLYTRQPLANVAGVFYGLPNQDKAQDDLWLDPVLFPTNALAGNHEG